MLSKRRNILLVVMVAVITYSVIFYLIFINLNDAVPIIMSLNIALLIPALLLRILSLTLHSISWYFILKVYYKELSITKVLTITLAAISTELLVPIGGVTEVAKILMLRQILSMPQDVIIPALLTHRLILTVVTALITMSAISVIRAPLDLTILLSTSIAGLLIINVVLLLIPSSNIFERIANRISSKFNLQLNDFPNKYRSSVRKLFTSGKTLLLISTLIILLEKLSNTLYGICLGMLVSTNIDFITSLIVFDSIYMIIWLLPLVTPGNIGVFEAVQIILLKSLGISLKISGILALINRVVTVVSEYPLLLLSTTYLGIRVKQLTDMVKSEKNHLV